LLEFLFLHLDLHLLLACCRIPHIHFAIWSLQLQSSTEVDRQACSLAELFPLMCSLEERHFEIITA